MNLSDHDVADAANGGVPMHVHAPDGTPLFQPDEKTPVTITLLGQDSDALTRIMNQRANRHLTRRGPGVLTIEQSITDEVSYLAKATVGWDGLGIDEEVTPFSEEAAASAYRRFPWLREQARAFVFDRARFTKASPKS